MQLKLDDNNIITAYATLGGLVDGVNYDGVVPEKFAETFEPMLYMLVDDTIVINSNYTLPSELPLTNQQDEINALFLKELATLHMQLGGLNNG